MLEKKNNIITVYWKENGPRCGYTECIDKHMFVSHAWLRFLLLMTHDCADSFELG